MIDSERCADCGRFIGEDTKVDYFRGVLIHRDVDDCPSFQASVEYSEGVSNYRVAVE